MTTLTNTEGYSLSIAAWLGDDTYDHTPVEGPYLSVTGLLKPMKILVLSQRLKNMQQTTAEPIDISRYVPSRLGTAIHSGIEATWKGNYKRTLLALGYPETTVNKIKVNPTKEEICTGDIPVYMEQRAFKKVGAYTIGGMFDFIGDGVLEDFKSMGVYSYMMQDKDEEQRLQGSIYRWLNPELVTSDHMLIQQIFTDWSKLDATIKKERGYPQSRILTKKLKLYTYQETDDWVRDRVFMLDHYKEAPEIDIPLCTKKDLWQSDTVYAYYKNKAGQRATKNYADYPAAHAHYLKDGSIGIVKERIGKVRRCGYCPAYEICKQKDDYIAQGILQMP